MGLVIKREYPENQRQQNRGFWDQIYKGRGYRQMIECESGKGWLNEIVDKGRWQRIEKWNYLATHWWGRVYIDAFSQAIPNNQEKPPTNRKNKWTYVSKATSLSK